MKRIGIIGAGIMAAGMAQNYIQHGYPVAMWNRSPERLDALLKLGVTTATTPRAVTEQSDIIIECVADDDASKGVWTGEHGILAGATPDKVLIASSSLSLVWTDELIELCRNQDCRFLDMPLTGSRAGAESGQLRLLIGGQAEVIDSIRPELEVIAEKIFHFGGAGAGMRFKLVLNSLIGIHMNAMGQALNLAVKAGIDPDVFAAAFIDGTMGPLSPSTKLVLDSKHWPADHVNFALQWLEKDLRYAQAMAEAYGVRFDLLDDTQHDYAAAKAAGLAEADVTAIARHFAN